MITQAAASQYPFTSFKSFFWDTENSCSLNTVYIDVIAQDTEVSNWFTKPESKI